MFGRPSSTNVHAAGFTGTSINWVIRCTPNCDSPYSFRAVNATGNSSQIDDGGFWSRLYWIKPSGSSSTTSATSTQSPTSSSSPSTSTTSSSAPSTSNSSESGNSSQGTAIGVGVGVGVGAALILIGGFFLWRRHHKKSKARNAWPVQASGSETVHTGPWPEQPYSQFSAQPHYEQPRELPGESEVRELSGQSKPINLQELPGQQPK